MLSGDPGRFPSAASLLMHGGGVSDQRTVLGLALMVLTFSTAARMVLCPGSVAKPVLTTSQHFGYR